MGGGYPQQGYQARPPTSWTSPGRPMQQPGYGYVQPGSYPGPSPQYNMPQQPYLSSYPQQPTLGGGYPPTSWDPTTGPQTQQTSQAGGYSYYNQQQTPLGPTDNTAYGYSQQGQGYTQCPASTPQSGYGQLSQANPFPGYDQNQGYSNSTPGYSTTSNQTTGGQTPPPYNTANQQPSPNPSYPPQGTTQSGCGVPPTSQTGYGTQPSSGYGPAGYGAPQAQKPPPPPQPAYGQTQLSPSVQPGYAHSQPPAAQSGYAQPDSSGAQRAPSSGYGTASVVPGYAPLPYGAQPLDQPSYAGPYTGSYGSSGYSSQPSAYSDDGNNARGTYDSAPASQTAQPGGAAKSSPES